MFLYMDMAFKLLQMSNVRCRNATIKPKKYGLIAEAKNYKAVFMGHAELVNGSQ
ncbi:MAG: hypothetical protein V4660_14145 [Pseudomonadota bacterium]